MEFKAQNFIILQDITYTSRIECLVHEKFRCSAKVVVNLEIRGSIFFLTMLDTQLENYKSVQMQPIRMEHGFSVVYLSDVP